MKKFFLGTSALILVLVLLVVFRKNNRITYETAVEKFVTPNSKFFDWDGIKLHYTDKGEGIPVVMLHGFGGSFDNWRKLIEEFPEGYRLIAADLPGFGLSQYDPAIVGEPDLASYYTRFASDLIDELDIDSCYLMGNSLGGYLSWETTLLRGDKVKKLVLLNSAGYSEEDINGFLINAAKSGLFKKIAKKGIPRAATKFAAKRVIGDKTKKPDAQRLDSFYGLLNKEGTLETIQTIGSAPHVIDTLRIKEIAVPTLIIWGDKDNIIPVEHANKFKRDIPNSELIIYEGSGHIPMIENSERLIKDILGFFNQNAV